MITQYNKVPFYFLGSGWHLWVRSSSKKGRGLRSSSWVFHTVGKPFSQRRELCSLAHPLHAKVEASHKQHGNIYMQEAAKD